MAIAAHRSFKLRIALAADGVVNFETRNLAFKAIKATIRPQFLSPHFMPPGTRDGVRIFHAVVSGLT
jgi:hypothetical protein